MASCILIRNSQKKKINYRRTGILACPIFMPTNIKERLYMTNEQYEAMRENSKFIEQYLAENFMYWNVTKTVSIENLTGLADLFAILHKTCDNNTTNYEFDLITDLLRVCELVHDKSHDKYVYYFGFRNNGVDHDDLITMRLSQHKPNFLSQPLYNAMCKLEIDKTEPMDKVTLYNLC